MGAGKGWRGVRSLTMVALVCAVIACSSPATPPIVPGTTAAPTATDATPATTTEAPLPKLATGSAPAYKPTTRSEELEAETGDPTSDPTLQQAIDMFSVTLTPLPGATKSDLPAGDGVGATVAMDAILDHQDELSAAQAKIVDSFLDAP